MEQRRRQWFEHYDRVGRHQLWVAELAGEVVGYATSSAFHPKAAYATSVETSVYVAPTHLRQGIGSLLYQQLFIALNSESIHRAYALISQPNLASERLHQKFGFQPVGHCREVGHKFGQYWDVKWFEKSLTYL